MNDNKISLMSEAANSNKFIAPVQLFERAVNDCSEGGCWEHAKKAVIIVLDTEGGKYNTSYAMSNISGSEALALAEVFKTAMLDVMGFINKEPE